MNLKNHIEQINGKGEKALSVFMTAGFPWKKDFAGIALSVLDSGADMLELGIPFSDPLADGPVIQYSSQTALQNNVNVKTVLEYTSEIKKRSDKPVILMGYSNPILAYGVSDFFLDSANAGADGVIVPDIPIDEFDSFFPNRRDLLDIIMLTTPNSPEERIRKADSLSSGFIYCVSVNGTTGERTSFSNETAEALLRTRNIIKKNKMLVGFGISNAESIRQISPFCDGVIVGSAVIKKLSEYGKAGNFSVITDFIGKLKQACI